MNEEIGSDADKMSSVHDIAKEGCNGTHTASKKVVVGVSKIWGTPNRKPGDLPYTLERSVLHQIEDIEDQMRKCPGIPLKDLGSHNLYPTGTSQGNGNTWLVRVQLQYWRCSHRHVRKEVSLGKQTLLP